MCVFCVSVCAYVCVSVHILRVLFWDRRSVVFYFLCVCSLALVFYFIFFFLVERFSFETKERCFSSSRKLEIVHLCVGLWYGTNIIISPAVLFSYLNFLCDLLMSVLLFSSWSAFEDVTRCWALCLECKVRDSLLRSHKYPLLLISRHSGRQLHNGAKFSSRGERDPRCSAEETHKFCERDVELCLASVFHQETEAYATSVRQSVGASLSRWHCRWDPRIQTFLHVCGKAARIDRWGSQGRACGNCSRRY